MFSKSCEYAFRALIYIGLCSQKGEKTSLKYIAENIDSPQSFTAKILQKLSKANILVSEKGANGGFIITQEKLQTTRLYDVVIVVDGDKIFTGCALGLVKCNSEKPCPLHYSFLEVREKLRKTMLHTNLEDMVNGASDGSSVLRL